MENDGEHYEPMQCISHEQIESLFFFLFILYNEELSMVYTSVASFAFA